MKRTGRLPQESAKRKAERPARQAVRQTTLDRAGYRCAAADIVPEIDCAGPLDVDERKSRGVNPGGHLDESNTQILCRAHHRWRTEHPDEAWKRGLRVKSWENDPRTLDAPAATIGDPEHLQGATPVQPAYRHVAGRCTVDWMCKGITIDGHWVHSAAELIDQVGLDIPADVLDKARAEHHFEKNADGVFVDTGPTGELYDLDTCFCCVNAEMILDGLGRTYTVDEIGDLVVTG